MNYALVWRTLVGLTIFFALLIPAFQYWTQHPFIVLGSVSFSRFLYAYWWEIVLGLLAISLLMLAALPLFDKGLPIWARAACAALSLIFPVFLPYWIVRIELPLWRARKNGNYDPGLLRKS